MKIDEQEFRSFIANLLLLENPMFKWGNEDVVEITRMKVENQLEKYKEMLETPKPSRWKQLKIDL